MATGLQKKADDKAKGKAELKKLRVKVDRIDRNIIKELHKRWTVSEKMRQLKKRYGTKIVEDSRIKEMKKKHKTASKSFVVPEEVIEKVFKVIVNESLKHQKK